MRDKISLFKVRNRSRPHTHSQIRGVDLRGMVFAKSAKCTHLGYSPVSHLSGAISSDFERIPKTPMAKEIREPWLKSDFRSLAVQERK